MASSDENQRGAAAVAPAARRSGFSPLRRLHERQLAAGVSVWLSALSFAALADGAGKWNAVLFAFSVGSYFVGTGVHGLRTGGAFPALSASLNLLRAGKLAEAEGTLATLVSPSRDVAVHADVQRAQIALRRGDPRAALRPLDRAIAAIESSGGSLEAAVISEARGLRAWSLSLLDDPRARDDIEAVRRAEGAGAAALSSASLAEALLAQRAGDRAELTSILRRDRRLLMYGLDVRERALVRAMQRAITTPATSVYRTAASVERAGHDDREEPPIAEWIGRVAPELLPFAPRPPSGADGAIDDEPAPSAAMIARVRARAQGATSDTGQGLALWLGLVALFLVWYRFAPISGGPLGLHPWITIASLGLPVLAFAAMRILSSRRRELHARLASLSARIAAGEDVDRDLDAFAEGEQDNENIAAQVELLRASIADRRGLLGKALEHADAARASLRSETGRAAAAAFIAPSATASRAYSLAALRRADEALAELSQLPSDYVHLDSTRFVVRLVALVAQGEIDAAGRLVDATPEELSIGPRDELVRDLVRAVTSPSGADLPEIARLREELRDDEEHRVWIERVAPDLLARFERTVAERTPRGRIAEDDDEALAEAAALAEQDPSPRASLRRSAPD